MNNILELAEKNQQRAWEIIKDTDIVNIWKSTGAEINLIGSLKSGLLMKHRDIDFHIYSSPLNLADNFNAMAKLAENPSVKRIEFTNLIDTDEHCLEWHAWYLDKDNELWQLDMIHILKGSFYDGYMENVTDRIIKSLTPEIKQAILQLKYDTPDNEKIWGIEYYQAVIRDGIRDYDAFTKWRKSNSKNEVIHWIP